MVAALALLLYPLCAAAQPFAYTVELEVPEAYRKLLQDHLEIYTSRDNPRMNADQLNLLVRRTPDRIREILATEGFYSPAIESKLEHKQGVWTARFSVAPGEPARVTAIDLDLRGAIAGAERDARLRDIRSRWRLGEGMIFRQAQWEQAKRDALRVLLTERYPAARIASSRATVNPKTGGVMLQVLLDSGPAFSFGALEVSGLQRYARSIVERLNPIEQGSAYSQAKLLQFQSRLRDSRYFASALVTADADPEHPERVPVRVQVVEMASRKLGFGAGVSTNTGARAQVEYEDLDFLDQAWRLSGMLKLESKKQSLGGEIQFPHTAGGYLDSVNATAERSDIQQQLTNKYGIGAKRAKALGDTETAFGPQYQSERAEIAGLPGDTRQALSFNYAWTRRNVNDLLYPADGLLLNVQLGAAARALLSDQDFLRGYVKTTYYRSVGTSGGLILRGELGATLARSRQGIPSEFLFRAGGDQSVRGYSYQSLGVKAGDAVVGGRYLGVASAEYVHWLSRSWGAALFYDVGAASDALRDLSPAHGYGAGARWKSPVGLLNMDLAYGREVKRLRLHFSVGISF